MAKKPEIKPTGDAKLPSWERIFKKPLQYYLMTSFLSNKSFQKRGVDAAPACDNPQATIKSSRPEVSEVKRRKRRAPILAWPCCALAHPRSESSPVTNRKMES